MNVDVRFGAVSASRRSAMRDVRHRLVLTALLVTALVLWGAGVARAAGPPFDGATPTVFVAQGSPAQLEAAVQDNGQVVFQNVGAPAGIAYNAISYNTADNYIYGIATSGPDAGRVVQVDANGTPTVLGIGVSAFSDNTTVNLGAFGPNGLLYVGRAGTVPVGDMSRLQVIDLARGTTSVLNLSQPLDWAAADLTYAAGYLWAASGASDLIQRIDPATGTLDVFPVPADLFPGGDNIFGAAWTYGNGNLGFQDNATGTVYQIAVTNPASATPTFSLVLSQPGPPNGLNDGTSAPGLPTDLAIVKDATPSVLDGGRITYTLTVTNNGPGNSSGYFVRDVLPAGLVNATTSTPGCSIAGGALTCVGNPLSAGASAAPITVTADAPTPFSSPVANSATVTGNEQDPNPDNDTGTATTRPMRADLALSKTATSSPAHPDQNLTYDLVVRNNGPDAAQNAVVTDQLPANVTFVSASTGCGVSGTTVTCRLASLAAGASHTFNVTVRVAASATGTLSNTATVTSDVPDPDTTDNGDREDVPVEPLADLELVKRALSSRLVPGRQIAYELTVTNFGPSTARDVRVSDPLPRGLSFVSASDGCTFASGTVTCTAAELASGRSLTFRVVTRVAASVTANSVANTATVDSSTRDPDTTNNSDRETVPSGPEADLSIVKVPSVDRVVVGGQLFYTLLVRNDGPSDAQSVVVTDTAGAGLTLLSASGGKGTSCSVSDSRATCRLGTLPAGGTAQVLVSARADQAGELTNVATVDSPTEDPDRRDNRDERRVTGDPPPVTVPQPADLSIVKTANRKTVVGSGTITYTLRVRNNGPGAASGVRVIDTPSGPVRVRSVRTSAGRCTTSAPIRCDLGTLQPGATATIRIVVQPRAAGALRNSASVTGDVPDPRPEDNIDGTSTKVQGLLKVVKTAGARTVRAGGTLTYKIRVTNASAFALRSVRVCDDLPSGLVFVSSTPKAKVSKGKRCWTVRALGAKKGKTFTLKVRVLSGAGGRKVNVATATAPNARGARSRAATGTAAIQVKPVAARGGGVTG
jgi:uncharacterized repeat protein (TIGR01451 family)